MDKFTTLEGVAAPLKIINVDTDMIIPKQYLKTIKRTGLGKGLFSEQRYKDDGSENPDFVLNQSAYRNAKVLVAGDNFGCGSSREHAPWALLDFGIRCVISTSFGDIFYNNCFKNGILLDADMVLDVRFLPNPFWVPELRPLNGLTDEVSGYVLGQPGASDFLDTYAQLLDPLLAGYRREGKTYLTVGIGCTGGKHRSVAVTEALAAHRVLFLDVGIADAAKRIGFDKSRPLLSVNPRQSWIKTMEARRPTYESLADHRVDTAGRDVEAVVAEALALLEESA